jgi:hypothetical protein
MDDAVETGDQRVLDHLRRPLPGSRDLLMGTAGNTVRAIDPTAEGSMGQVRVHPLVGAANELRKTLSLLLRDLAVPMPGEEEGRRRSPQQAAAARARWDRRTGA